MTRWKKEQIETLVLQHAHNHWSTWNDCLVTAAEELGCFVGTLRYPNCSGDGSWDTETYVLAASLKRIGGMDAIHARASELHEKAMQHRNQFTDWC